MKKSVSVFVKIPLDNFQRFSFFILFMLFAIGAFAQNKITGIVTDITGEPVIGASVVVKGTTNGSITDLNGNFSILNAPQNATLIVSYIGYETQTIVTNGRHELKVSLAEDKKTLEEKIIQNTMKLAKRQNTFNKGQFENRESNIIPSLNSEIIKYFSI